MKRILIAMFIMAASMNLSCTGLISVNNEDRDVILDKIGGTITDLLKRIDDLQATLDVQRSKLSMDLQQLMGLTISNLRAAIADLTRSVDTMKVAMTNLQETAVAEATHVVTALGEQVDALQKGLSVLATDTIQRLGGEIERQRVGALRQMQQLVQDTIRPTMERLSREGDYFVGKVTFAANVLLVRVVAGIVAMIALIGLVIALLKLQAPSRRWPAVGLSTVLFLGSFSSATLLASPISRIGAIEHKIPDGKAVCARMSELGRKLLVEWHDTGLVPANVVDPDKAASLVTGAARRQAASQATGAALAPRGSTAASTKEQIELAIQVKDAAIECKVWAPTGELTAQAHDYFVAASEFLGERVTCTTHADCLDGKRCDDQTGECLVLGAPYCEAQTDCSAGFQCDVHSRCVRIDDGSGRCTTPNDCRPEQACDLSIGRCVVIADMDPNATCEVAIPGVKGPCKQGKRRAVDRWVRCVQTTEATPELCDGVDNNCNGTVDEAIQRSEQCIASGSRGECSAHGSWRCNGAAGWTCVAASPQVESCNGLDDDCDGTVDNGVPQGSSCRAGVGECEKTATLQCRGTLGMQCIPGPARSEVCDGKDNNCDGKIDNDIAEVCKNGIDDNCNGQVDEGCGHGDVPKTCPAGMKCCSPTGDGKCEPGACKPRNRDCE